MGAPASARAATMPLSLTKMCTGRRPVHKSRKLNTFSPDILSALATPAWSRSHIGRGRSRGSSGRCTLIVLPVVDISVHHAVIILIGPDRAGETADRSTDDRAL